MVQPAVGDAGHTGAWKRRQKVTVTVPYETLIQRAGHGPVGDHLITPESARRLACDAGVHRLITHADTAIVEYGSETRTVSDVVWRVLVDRDGGCRFPGCEIGAEFCAAHHAEHWADGGETNPHNLTLRCRFHHHVLHEQHWSLEPLGAGHFVSRSPTGKFYEFGTPRLGQLGVL